MQKGWGIVGAVMIGGFAACGGGTPPSAATPPVATEALGEGAGTAPLPPDDAGVDAPAAVAAAPAVAWTTLAKNLHGSSALAVDKSSVYWINESDGALQRIPKHGGITMNLYSGTGTAFQPGASIAVDATDVYWTSATVAGGTKSNTLTRQDKNGGKPSVVASSPVSSLRASWSTTPPCTGCRATPSCRPPRTAARRWASPAGRREPTAWPSTTSASTGASRVRRRGSSPTARSSRLPRRAAAQRSSSRAPRAPSTSWSTKRTSTGRTSTRS